MCQFVENYQQVAGMHRLGLEFAEAGTAKTPSVRRKIEYFSAFLRTYDFGPNTL